MDLVFCGTPEFAVPTLDALLAAGHSIRLVVSQPDRPRGRGQQLAIGAVKRRALELGLPVTQPEKIKNNPEFRAQLEALAPRAIIVVAYGRIIPPWMLQLAPLGAINLHASLLPKYRGAAPIQWAIGSGEKVTGATTMHIDEGLDTGAILLQRKIEIGEDDTAVTLAPKIAALGAELMIETLRGLGAGELRATPQNHSEATLAPLLKKEDGRMDFNLPAQVLVNRLRGFQPWPGAFTTFRGKNLQILQARVAGSSPPTSPGEISLTGRRILIACGGGSALELLELQPEGKSRMAAEAFINGYHPQPLERLPS